MTGKELERLLERLTPLGKRDLDVRGRELRKLRMVPSGPRGPNAPDFAPEHIATFLIAVAGTDNASHAGRAVIEYAPLVPSDVKYSGFACAETFADGITHMIAEPSRAKHVRKIRICRSHPRAEILWVNSDGEAERTIYVREGSGDIYPEGFGGGTMTVWAEIGPGLIGEIGIKLQGHDAGWVVEESEGGDA